jgi:putative copper resistance protein D
VSFIDVPLRGAGLAGQALALGGVAFVLLVLRAWSIDEARRPLLRRSLGLIALGAATLALTQTLGAVLEIRALADENGWPLRDALDTLYFQANVVRLAGCTTLAATAVALTRRPSRRGWSALALSAAVVAAASAGMAHAVGQLHGRAPLVALTGVHQLAAAV